MCCSTCFPPLMSCSPPIHNPPLRPLFFLLEKKILDISLFSFFFSLGSSAGGFLSDGLGGGGSALTARGCLGRGGGGGHSCHALPWTQTPCTAGSGCAREGCTRVCVRVCAHTRPGVSTGGGGAAPTAKSPPTPALSPPNSRGIRGQEELAGSRKDRGGGQRGGGLCIEIEARDPSEQ